MSIVLAEQGSTITTIACDKCDKTQSAQNAMASAVFFNSGWALNTRALKYVHTCRDCQSKGQRTAHDFVKQKFPLP